MHSCSNPGKEGQGRSPDSDLLPATASVCLASLAQQCFACQIVFPSLLISAAALCSNDVHRGAVNEVTVEVPWLAKGAHLALCSSQNAPTSCAMVRGSFIAAVYRSISRTVRLSTSVSNCSTAH